MVTGQVRLTSTHTNTHVGELCNGVNRSASLSPDGEMEIGGAKKTDRRILSILPIGLM